MTDSALPEVSVGAPIGPSPIASLDDLIAQLQERRIEQMLHIAFLMAEDADPTEAEDKLRWIESLLVTMRLHSRPSQDGRNERGALSSPPEETAP